jgi:hypothetical protein
LSQVDEAEHDRLHGWFEVAKIRLLAPVFGPLIGFQQPKGGKGHWVWEFMNGRVADPDGLKAAELLRQYTNSPEKFAEWLRRMEIAGPGTADGYVAVAKSFLRALALMPPKSRFGERTWGKPSRQDVEQIRRTEARLGVPGLFLKEKFEWEQDTVPAKDEVNHE